LIFYVDDFVFSNLLGKKVRVLLTTAIVQLVEILGSSYFVCVLLVLLKFQQMKIHFVIGLIGIRFLHQSKNFES